MALGCLGARKAQSSCRGGVKYEAGDGEHFLLCDVQQGQLFCLWNWPVPGLTLFRRESISEAGHNMLTVVKPSGLRCR